MRTDIYVNHEIHKKIQSHNTEETVRNSAQTYDAAGISTAFCTAVEPPPDTMTYYRVSSEWNYYRYRYLPVRTCTAQITDKSHCNRFFVRNGGYYSVEIQSTTV